MKLLLVSDTKSILSEFELRGETYFYQSVEIDFFYIDNFYNSINELYILVLKNRFHLCIFYSKAYGIKETIHLLNSVNNYGSTEIKSLISASKLSEHPYFNSTVSLPSIVNRTTSYFNIFLDIEKGVSESRFTSELSLELKRLDCTNDSNYTFGFIMALMSYPYYILNYNETIKLKSDSALVEVIKLLD